MVSQLPMTTNQPPLSSCSTIVSSSEKIQQRSHNRGCRVRFLCPTQLKLPFHTTNKLCHVIFNNGLQATKSARVCVCVRVLCNQRILTSQFFPLTSTHLEALMLALFNRLWGLLLGLLGPFCNADAFWLVLSAFSIPSDIGGL